MTSVTVVVPMTIRRRGGRKRIIGPDGAPIRTGDDVPGAAETRGDPALVKALARAFRWRRMLEEGRYGSIRELAAAEQMERTSVARALGLTLLAPDIVEAVLDGREPVALSVASFRRGLPDAWEAQWATLVGAGTAAQVGRGPLGRG
ncbi:hypothetical protein [Rubritepida flocculans]|uniref:hypothetical protein n=1 Tax=Rubritepida flocculans TaxID=182403 RepID=UPI00041BD05C|nr:hypothetical protein [Rubritepida flocculans]